MSGKSSKILTLSDLAERAAVLRGQGMTVVHCHGVFDLLHIGHIKHLTAAKDLGDVLVVTVTPDEHVNKGPHRPAFKERHRLEALAALECVDHVALNLWPTAVETIQLLKPDVYVKGRTQQSGPRDHTDAILREEKAVDAIGGRLVLTDEETYSASALINRHLDVFPPEVWAFLEEFRSRHGPEEAIETVKAIRGLKVLAIGETIIDEYQFCLTMNKANKDPILAAQLLRQERYAGGILAIANHLAGFCDKVGVLTFLGERDRKEEFVESSLDARVQRHFFTKSDSPTIVKRRFLEEYMAVKLFEVYHYNSRPLSGPNEDEFLGMLEDLVPKHDVILVADYGHGLITERGIAYLARHAPFLAVNAQLNAGNRGFNCISKYPRADYITIDEPEARLEARNQLTDVRGLVRIIAERVDCPRILLTQGKKGSICYDRGDCHTIPALGFKVVDRMGAGDAVFALTAPCVAANASLDLAAFVGNVAGAEACAVMGNKSSIDPTTLFRHITSLLS